MAADGASSGVKLAALRVDGGVSMSDPLLQYQVRLRLRVRVRLRLRLRVRLRLRLRLS